ncbi:MAG: uroporphyrinogen decarboxylase [Chlamydiales bacterium]|nr:uroporphyrinogen decarboxylase [Chlamydiales bacterium]
MNTLLLDALALKNKKRPPVWLMRQAGRYMPTYQQIRAKTSLLEMFHHPGIIEQVTMLPIEILDVDAAILFSDILLPLECIGLNVYYPNGGGPYVEPLITADSYPKQEDVLRVQEVLSFVYTSITNLKKRLNVPLIGFAGAPFTTLTYALEEKGKHAQFTNTKSFIKHYPVLLHQLLNLLTEVIIEHLKLQIKAGADVVQVFDSWAGELSASEFLEFSLPYLEKIVDAIKPTNIPIIIFARGSCTYAKEIASIHPNAISLDSTLPVWEIRKKLGKQIALQGNIEPMLLFESIDTIEKQVNLLKQQMKGDKGFIMNLGHGVLPGTNQDHVRAFVQAVKSV